MNLRKRMDVDIIDLSLKHTLKNWVSRGQPPIDGKASLLSNAMRTSRQATRPKTSKLAGWVSMTLNEDFIEIYFESYKKNPDYSLQPGSFSLNFTSGLIAK